MREGKRGSEGGKGREGKRGSEGGKERERGREREGVGREGVRGRLKSDRHVHVQNKNEKNPYQM